MAKLYLISIVFKCRIPYYNLSKLVRFSAKGARLLVAVGRYIELAHYIQSVEYGKSSCESKLGTNEYNPQLAKEHEEFTTEIEQMIINLPEYQEFKQWWQAKYSLPN